MFWHGVPNVHLDSPRTYGCCRRIRTLGVLIGTSQSCRLPQKINVPNIPSLQVGLTDLADCQLAWKNIAPLTE
jgi:hypothetical protein